MQSLLFPVALVSYAMAASILGPGPIIGCPFHPAEAHHPAHPDGGVDAQHFEYFQAAELVDRLLEPTALVMPVKLDSTVKEEMEAAKNRAGGTKEAEITKEAEVTKENEEAAEDVNRDTRQLLDDFGIPPFDMPPLDAPPPPPPRRRPLRRRRPYTPSRYASPWLFGYTGQI